ncbi:MAG: hypothetical protein AAGI44_15560 [Pseudomonadota bacterium]
MPDWGELFLQPEWLDRVDRLAERRFGSGGLSEEGAAYVLQVVSDNDWERCRQFKGKSSPETFLYTVVNNALEEFSRKRFGRVRPPEWLKLEGPTWIELWKMVCMERQAEAAVIDRQLMAGRDEATVKRILRTIKARMPWCGSSVQEIPVQYFRGEDGDEQSALDTLASDGSAESEANDSRIELMILSIAYLLETPEDASQRERLEQSISSMSETLVPVLRRVRTKVALSDDERLILSMNFRDGIKKNKIAAVLGLQDHQPGRIGKRVFERIKAALNAEGLEPPDFL